MRYLKESRVSFVQQTKPNLGEIPFIMNFYLMTCLLPIRATADYFDFQFHDFIQIKNDSDFLVGSSAGFALSSSN